MESEVFKISKVSRLCLHWAIKHSDVFYTGGTNVVSLYRVSQCVGLTSQRIPISLEASLYPIKRLPKI